jgi:hypothetical protein
MRLATTAPIQSSFVPHIGECLKTAIIGASIGVEHCQRIR